MTSHAVIDFGAGASGAECRFGEARTLLEPVIAVRKALHRSAGGHHDRYEAWEMLRLTELTRLVDEALAGRWPHGRSG
ncbi:hypothetical protein ABZ281_06735 [Streptomyces sp. NPDC006265]|uniref:hypothetical protein n=1 Tax=Streptomyces sp. NPDC006265 TaxID=3156740 RepID=UPI0033A54278